MEWSTDLMLINVKYTLTILNQNNSRCLSSICTQSLHRLGKPKYNIAFVKCNQ